MIESRRIRWAGHVDLMEKTRNVYKTVVGKPKGRRPLGALRRSWKDSIRMDLREIGWESRLDSSGSGEGPVAGSCEHGNETSGSIKAGNFLTS
jgi:hypothetical protein